MRDQDQLSDGVFKALGLSSLEERVYQAVLQEPGISPTELAGATQLTRDRITKALGSLEERGLVTRISGKKVRFAPAPPDTAIELLILKQHEVLQRARLAAGELTKAFRAKQEAVSPLEIVEVVRGRNAVGKRANQLAIGMQEEALVFVKPPFARGVEESESDEVSMLRREVRVRAIYDREALDASWTLDHIRTSVAAGEEARVTPQLPMKMLIADRRVALVPLLSEIPGNEGALLVHESPLLDALIALFEKMWESSGPATFERGDADRGMAGELTIEEQKLLMLLMAGFKDDAIARKLEISSSTVKRRLREVMNRLGARTRFQAGLLACRRGWLDSEPTPNQSQAN